MAIPLSASLRTLLEQQAYGHVITFNRDGSPQVTMVWMDVREGVPIFNTAVGRVKERNLRRDPRVIVSVQDPASPQQYALLEGTATLSEPGAIDQIHRLARKYTGRDQYALRPGEVRVAVDIALQRVSGRGPWAA